MKELENKKATLDHLRNKGLIDDNDFTLLNKELDEEIAELKKKLKDVRRKIADNDLEGLMTLG